jgi:hypothetical protein
MMSPKFPHLWWAPVFLIAAGVGLLSFYFETPSVSFISYSLMIAGVFWLLLWADAIDAKGPRSNECVGQSVDETSLANEIKALRSELQARILEASAFKAELEAKHSEIAALRAGQNRTDSAELNEAIAQLYIAFEFERGRAEGEFRQILAGLMESVDSLFAAAALVKGAPAPGARFVDQPAGACKVFKTEPAGSPELKGTIKVVRSPWVGFMVNGKLKVIVASNISVYA